MVCTFFRWPRLAAIPVVFLAFLGFCYLFYAGYLTLMTTHTVSGVSVIVRNFVLYLSLPLGVYWWVTEGPGALFEVFRKKLVCRLVKPRS